MKSRIIVLLFLIATVSTGYAQKIKQISGNLSPLKGQKTLNIIYDYNGLKVGDKKEVDYVKEKVKKYNSDERGKGDKWKEEWLSNRPNKFQPQFEELFNKYLENAQITAKEGNTESQYTIKVKTTMIEPGFNAGVMRRPASLEAEIEVFETATPNKIVCKLKITKVVVSNVAINGVSFDFDTGSRITETYAKLGKGLAKYIVKKIK